jgi:hypothetical protein
MCYLGTRRKNALVRYNNKESKCLVLEFLERSLDLILIIMGSYQGLILSNKMTKLVIV